MKLGDKLFYGLLFVGVGLLIYNYKDKLFKRKEDKNNSSSGSDSVRTPPKPINTENLGLNTPPPSTILITPSTPSTPSKSTTYKDKYGNLKYVPLKYR